MIVQPRRLRSAPRSMIILPACMPALCNVRGRGSSSKQERAMQSLITFVAVSRGGDGGVACISLSDTGLADEGASAKSGRADASFGSGTMLGLR